VSAPADPPGRVLVALDREELERLLEDHRSPSDEIDQGILEALQAAEGNHRGVREVLVSPWTIIAYAVDDELLPTALTLDVAAGDDRYWSLQIGTTEGGRLDFAVGAGPRPDEEQHES
jgi:thiazole synthase ThiGH ThiG subunit